MDTRRNSHREEDRLATELEYYAAHKEAFLKSNPGEYIVIRATKILGFFQSWEQAIHSGVVAFGVREDFLVKQVLAREQVYFVF